LSYNPQPFLGDDDCLLVLALGAERLDLAVQRGGDGRMLGRIDLSCQAHSFLRVAQGLLGITAFRIGQGEVPMEVDRPTRELTARFRESKRMQKEAFSIVEAELALC